MKKNDFLALFLVFLLPITGCATTKTSQAGIKDKSASQSQSTSMRAMVRQLERRITKLEKKQKSGVETQFSDRLFISGGLNVQASLSQRSTPTSFTGDSDQALNLNVAHLNVNALLTKWLRTYLAFAYEPNAVTTSTGTPSTGPEIEQAYLQLAKDGGHFHFDLGKQFLPFGVYNRYPIVDSLTQSLAEINKVAAVFGYHKGQFFIQGYDFYMQGSLSGFGEPPENRLANGGAEVGLLKVSDKFGYEVSLDYLTNLAETRFIYGLIKATHQSIGAIAAHVSVNYKRLGFVGNWVGALSHFDSRDITFNNSGALPSAYEVELNYIFPVNNKPYKIGFGYEHSSEALFLSLPLFRYVFTMSYSFNKYLTLTVDALWSKDYATIDQATYATGESTVNTINGTNRWSTAGVVELAAHF